MIYVIWHGSVGAICLPCRRLSLMTDIHPFMLTAAERSWTSKRMIEAVFLYVYCLVLICWWWDHVVGWILLALVLLVANLAFIHIYYMRAWFSRLCLHKHIHACVALEGFKPVCWWWPIWAIQNEAKILKNDPGIWVLIWEYSTRAFQWIPTLQGLDGFQNLRLLVLWTKVALAEILFSYSNWILVR